MIDLVACDLVSFHPARPIAGSTSVNKLSAMSVSAEDAFQSLVGRFFDNVDVGVSSCVLGGADAKPIASAQLWAMAQAHRAALRARGLQRGDVIAMALPTSTAVLATLLAAWADGIAVVLLPYEVADHSGRLAPAKFAQMLELVTPACLLVDAPLLQYVPRALQPGALTLDHFHQQADALEAVVDGPTAVATDIAILQFTSGSTGLPKAAVISHAMLAANCAAIAARVRVVRSDRMASWLPMHHDMGLSAVTLAWWGGIDLVMLPTAMFVRQPLSWLEAISTHKASLSPAPASAYAILSRFSHAAAVRKLDLSTWRYAWAGAEPVFHKHMQQFIDAMQVLGLRRDVVQPAYGMAESVVAVALNAPGQQYRALWVDARALKEQGRVELRLPDSEGAVAHVSNGRPVDGIQITVRDTQARPLGAGRSGTLHIRGDSVIRSYVGHVQACDADGWYDTGDIGFVHEGEVFISGRAKDVITRAGLNVSPQELEWVVEEALALKEGSAAAFSYTDSALAQERVVVVVAKRPESADADSVRHQIAVAVAKGTGIQLDEVIFVKRSSLPKTTSGKIQRGALRNARLRGELISLI